MTPTQHLLVKKLFILALDMPTDEIKEFITTQTNDKEVINHVTELLETYQNNTQYTKDYATEIADNLSKSPMLFPSERYLLIKKIGQGGMGDVFLAQRKLEGIKQKVAIKILQLNDEMSKERFLQERAILSQLSHTNISQFIDADYLTDGRPYVVMEYFSGINIIDYCNKANSCIKERIKLFHALCKAVQHAHQNLIIHRDIKPDNILVNDKGELKLLDFGISKIVQESIQSQTNTQMHALTPAYASPEQIAGKPVTITSDVYSLGVVLYELLCGKRPYEPREYSPIEYEKLLKEKSPVKPSLTSNKPVKPKGKSIYKMIKGDLDTITLKALQYDTSLRYQTVAELIEDLNRYEMNLPVLAQTPKFGYTINKFFKRNRLMVGFSVLAFVLIAAFVTLLVVKNKKIQESADKLLVQRNEAIREKKRAEALSDIFIQAFKNADPTRTNGENISALEIMENTARIIKSKFFNNPILKSHLLISISQVYINLGKPQKANQIVSKIQGNYKILPYQDKINYINVKVISDLKLSNNEHKIITLIENALYELGKDSSLVYTYGQVLRHYVYYEKAESFLKDYFNTLSVTDEYYIPICSIYGYVVLSNEKFTLAKKILNQCLSIAKVNSVDKMEWEISKIYLQLGRLNLELNMPYNALNYFRKSKAIRTKLFGNDSLLTTDLSIYISNSLILAGKPEIALNTIENGIKGRLKAAQEGVGNDASVTKALFSKANAYYAMKNYTKAINLYKKCIELRKEYGLEGGFNTASYYRKLGQSNYFLRDYNHAIYAYKRAIEIYQDERYEDYNNASETSILLAQSYVHLGKLKKAKKITQVALSVLEEKPNKNIKIQRLGRLLLSKIDMVQ